LRERFRGDAWSHEKSTTSPPRRFTIRQAGYPERFAQQALGNNSKAVHHAYSKHAEVTVPSLYDWERQWQKNPQEMQKPKVVPVEFQEQLQTASIEGPAIAFSQAN
jgi:hypothetical protein